MNTQFYSLLVGESTLAVHCGRILLKAGHEIRAVRSPDTLVREWAQAENVPYMSGFGEFVSFAYTQPFDYLFSIVNFQILPESLLQMPRRLAVNYHDAPLPKYAGSYATTWAILNQEATHAITWHVMTGRVDAGDILKQVTFPIKEQGETTYTLRIKCYVAAIRSFAELISELDAGTFTRTKQDLSKRTFFYKSKRPTEDSVIPFDWPADRVDAFCRALDFGPQPNPIGVPKIRIGSELYAVSRVEKCDSRSGAHAGTIIQIGDGFLRVATATADVVLRGLRTLEGREVNPLSLENLTARAFRATSSPS